MIDTLLQLSPSIRYVAIYANGHLESKAKGETLGASSAESDRYEELLVNPTLLKLASQRGNIDCGGLRFLVIRYGNFFQLVVPTHAGHVSVCIEADANPLEVGARVIALLPSVLPT